MNWGHANNFRMGAFNHGSYGLKYPLARVCVCVCVCVSWIGDFTLNVHHILSTIDDRLLHVALIVL